MKHILLAFPKLHSALGWTWICYVAFRFPRSMYCLSGSTGEETRKSAGLKKLQWLRCSALHFELSWSRTPRRTFWYDLSKTLVRIWNLTPADNYKVFGSALSNDLYAPDQMAHHTFCSEQEYSLDAWQVLSNCQIHTPASFMSFLFSPLYVSSSDTLEFEDYIYHGLYCEIYLECSPGDSKEVFRQKTLPRFLHVWTVFHSKPWPSSSLPRNRPSVFLSFSTIRTGFTFNITAKRGCTWTTLKIVSQYQRQITMLTIWCNQSFKQLPVF